MPDIKHGSVSTDTYGSAMAVSHGQEIHYECRPGFDNGTVVPRCDNGTWTAEAVCKPGTVNFIGLFPP